jgi:hypothetical protein
MTSQNPISFISEMKLNNLNLKYFNLKEIVQGGPEVGNICIDNVIIASYLFGGPFIFYQDNIYLPVFINKFFKRGFKLAKINLNNLDVEIYGSFENYINLYKIEDNTIYFYKDINNVNIGQLKIL